MAATSEKVAFLLIQLVLSVAGCLSGSVSLFCTVVLSDLLQDPLSCLVICPLYSLMSFLPRTEIHSCLNFEQWRFLAVK